MKKMKRVIRKVRTILGEKLFLTMEEYQKVFLYNKIGKEFNEEVQFNEEDMEFQ